MSSSARESVFLIFRILPRRRKITFLGLLVARILVNFLDVVGLAVVGLLGAMMATGLADESAFRFAGFEVVAEGPSDYLLAAASFATLFLLKSVLAALLLRSTVLFLARNEIDAVDRLVKYVFEDSPGSWSQLSSGRLIWVFSASSSNAFSVVLNSIATLAAELSLVTMVLITFIIVNWSVALYVLLFFGVVGGFYHRFASKKSEEIGEGLAASSVEFVNAVHDLQAVKLEAWLSARAKWMRAAVLKARSAQAGYQARQKLVQGLTKPAAEIALVSGFVGLLAWVLFQDSLGEGLVVAGVVLAGSFRLVSSLIPLQNALNELRLGIKQGEAAQTLLAEANAKNQAGDFYEVRAVARQADLAAGVKFHGVSYTYPDGSREVLEDISFKVRKGEMVSIAGPSGAGKSTLASLLTAQLRPDEGSIEIFGMSPKEFVTAFPGKLAMVPQRPNLVRGTIRRNIDLGGNIDVNHVLEAATKAGLDSLIDSLPHGLETLVGENADNLSGGQIQRIGLARSLISRPNLLILDEMTGPLDLATEKSIVDSIEKLAGELTVITIAHRVSTLERCDRLIVLRNGKISYEGPPVQEQFDELLNPKS